ncbi:MAG: LytTR family transcriptional regulator [Bacteroidales bacterium]|nr:LytTR family transcriptional regulator [Bacteroidales bacterium]
MSEYIYFNSRDELLRVDTTCVVYFEASGNYTKIVLKNGESGIVGFNLAKIEQTLTAALGPQAKRFARVGKSYIINLTCIFRINPIKQELVLSNQKTFSFTINASKEALRMLKEIIMKHKQTKTQE